jgi:prolyl 4-hydroxylase
MASKSKIGRKLDGTWPAWLQENLERRCDPEQLLAILLKNGFSLVSIRDHMGTAFPVHSALAGGMPGADPEADYAAISAVALTRAHRPVMTPLLQLYMLEGFLSVAECDRITDIAMKHLRPSTVTTGARDKGYRTSSTSDLSLLKDKDIAAIDEKIARALGIRLPYSEGIQAQLYQAGQEFRQHTDYFQPGSQEYADYAGQRGQRTWTFMVYLNDGMAGGGTKFFAPNLVVTPQKGMALAWNNLYEDGAPNPDTLHSGQPVELGHKIIITKWFRDRGYGPMFY